MIEADSDLRGIKDGSSSPPIEARRVMTIAPGVSPEEARQLTRAFQKRGPIFTKQRLKEVSL